MSGQAVTTSEGARLPAVDPGRPWDSAWQPPWLISRLNAVSTWDRKPEVPQALALTDGMRASILTRIDAMQAELKPASVRERTAIVAELLAFYSTSSQDEISLRAKLSVWVETLEGVPAWALREAVRRWHAGRLNPNTSFCPSPATILNAAGLVIGGVQGQIVAMTRLLSAQVVVPISEDEKARVGALMRGWAEEMRRVADSMDKRTKAPPLQPGGGDEQAVVDGDARDGSGGDEHGAGDTAAAG